MYHAVFLLLSRWRFSYTGYCSSKSTFFATTSRFPDGNKNSVSRYWSIYNEAQLSCVTEICTTNHSWHNSCDKRSWKQQRIKSQHVSLAAALYRGAPGLRIEDLRWFCTQSEGCTYVNHNMSSQSKQLTSVYTTIPQNTRKRAWLFIIDAYTCEYVTRTMLHLCILTQVLSICMS